MDNQRDIEVLNTLIVTTIDSALGFEESARDVRTQAYEGEFRQFGRERRSIVDELQAQVRRLGGTPEDEGSVKAAGHRRWVEFKSVIAGKSDKAVIAEVNKGETYIREKYEVALQDDKLSPETRSVLEKGFGSVRAGQFFASRLDGALSSASSNSSTRNRWGVKVAGAAGLAAVTYVAYRMFRPGRSSQERRSPQPRLAQEHGGGRDASGQVRAGHHLPASSPSTSSKT